MRESFAEVLFVLLLCLLPSLSIEKKRTVPSTLLLTICISAISMSHPLVSFILLTVILALAISQKFSRLTPCKSLLILTTATISAWYTYVAWAYVMSYRYLGEVIWKLFFETEPTGSFTVSFETGGNFFLLFKGVTVGLGVLLLALLLYQLIYEQIKKKKIFNATEHLFSLWLILSSLAMLAIYGTCRLLPWGAMGSLADTAVRFEPYLFMMLAIVVGFSLNRNKLFSKEIRCKDKMGKKCFVGENIVYIVAVCIFILLNLAVFSSAPTTRLLSDANNPDLCDQDLLYSEGKVYVTTQLKETTITHANELVYFRHVNSLFSASNFVKSLRSSHDVVYVSSRVSTIVMEVYYNERVIDIRNRPMDSAINSLYLASPLDAYVYGTGDNRRNLNSSLIYSNAVWEVYRK
jgi:hypothetical protein